MILCDIGNTSYHFLDEDDHNYKEYVDKFDPSRMKKQIFYISVNVKEDQKLQHLDNWIDLSQYVDRQKYYPMMGIDRIVGCEAIEDGLIVDAGSAVTVDLMQKGEYKGGFIYPGVQKMAQTYQNISSALDYSFNFEVDLDKMAKNPQDSISYGI